MTDELQTRMTLLMDSLIKPSVQHPGAVSYVFDGGVTNVLVTLTVRAGSDWRLVIGKQKSRAKGLEKLLGYIAAQYGRGARLFVEET